MPELPEERSQQMQLVQREKLESDEDLFVTIGTADRISRLPDDLIIEIMGHLTQENLVNLVLTARRYGELSKRLTCVNLTNKHCVEFDLMKNSRFYSNPIITTFRLNHELPDLSYSFETKTHNTDNLSSWIGFLSGKGLENVQILGSKPFGYMWYCLPENLFGINTLRTLMLENQRGDQEYQKMETLESLDYRLTFRDQLVYLTSLLELCPNLIHLHLRFTVGWIVLEPSLLIEISSKSLRTLDISGNIRISNNPYLEITLKLDTPRLESLIKRLNVNVKVKVEVIGCADSLQLEMAEGETSTPNAELLEWPQKDKRRFLHALYCVANLNETIKFYTECFGMKLLRKWDFPEEKYTEAFLGFGPEESDFVVQLRYYYGVDSYDIGSGLGHFAIATPDVYKLVEDIKAKGGTVTQEPGPVKGGSTVIAIVKDPTGYLFEIIERGSTPEPVCQVRLCVGDLERSIKFYEKALGMKVVKKVDRPEQKYSMAAMAYAPEPERAVLQLTYHYGITEYRTGNGYAQIAISTDDVYKSREVVKLVNQELGGEITCDPWPLPGHEKRIVTFRDPDGWKTVLINNEVFLKEEEVKMQVLKEKELQ